jgi:hypothetical protein
MSRTQMAVIGVTVIVLSVLAGIGISSMLRKSPATTAAVVPTTSATAAPAATGQAVTTDTSSGFTDSLDGAGFSAYRAACRTIRFPMLNKDADALAGKHYRIKGQVFQILDAGKGMVMTDFPDGIEPRTSMLVSMTSDGYGYWSDEIEVAYIGALPKVYQKNVITVYGVCVGQYSYTSVAGYDMTVPLILARYVTKS